MSSVSEVISFISTFARRVATSEGEVDLHTVSEANLSEIVLLDCSSSGIECIPKSMSLLRSLESINLSRNSIASVEPLVELPKLTTLTVNKNKACGVPAGMMCLKQLERLYVSRSNLQLIPEEIGSLTNLHTVNLRNNRLASVPDGLFCLPNLVELDVSENEISYLPDDLSGAKSLRRLYVSGNDLVAIPSTIGSLRRLTSLAISVNNIRALPVEFGSLKLDQLWIYDNPLVRPPIHVAEQGIGRIRDFFRSHDEAGGKHMAVGGIFLSHAREDSLYARKLFEELIRDGFDPWLDEEKLLPGQKWETAIDDAIKQSDYFIAILSSNSVEKRGYVQKEIRRALDIVEMLPERSIFVIPVRLDECQPSHPLLEKLHWVDLHYDDEECWEKGYAKIVQTLKHGVGS